MTRDEYEKLKRRIHADYQRDLEALERVWMRTREPDAPPAATNEPAQPSSGKVFIHSYGNDLEGGIQALDTAAAARMDVLRLVRENVADRGDDFTMNHVYSAIIQDHPELQATLKKPSITSALSRLAELGELVLLEVGSGKRPSRFRRATPAEMAQSKREEKA